MGDGPRSRPIGGGQLARTPPAPWPGRAPEAGRPVPGSNRMVRVCLRPGTHADSTPEWLIGPRPPIDEGAHHGCAARRTRRSCSTWNMQQAATRGTAARLGLTCRSAVRRGPEHLGTGPCLRSKAPSLRRIPGACVAYRRSGVIELSDPAGGRDAHDGVTWSLAGSGRDTGSGGRIVGRGTARTAIRRAPVPGPQTSGQVAGGGMARRPRSPERDGQRRAAASQPRAPADRGPHAPGREVCGRTSGSACAGTEPEPVHRLHCPVSWFRLRRVATRRETHRRSRARGRPPPGPEGHRPQMRPTARAGPHRRGAGHGARLARAGESDFRCPHHEGAGSVSSLQSPQPRGRTTEGRRSLRRGTFDRALAAPVSAGTHRGGWTVASLRRRWRRGPDDHDQPGTTSRPQRERRHLPA